MSLLKLLRRLRRNRWRKVILRAIVRDWRYYEDPQGLPDAEAGAYRLRVESTRQKHQTFISLESEKNPSFGAELFLEVNQGVPCLHASNAVNGDNVLHIFFTENGIVVVPEADDERPLAVLTSRYYPGSRGFSSLYHNPTEPAPEAVCAA